MRWNFLKRKTAPQIKPSGRETKKPSVVLGFYFGI